MYANELSSNYSIRTVVNCFYDIIRGIFGSAQEIYRESGLAGFFQGLVPRITGEILAIVLASSVTYTVNTYIISDPRYKAAFKTAVGVLHSLQLLHIYLFIFLNQ